MTVDILVDGVPEWHNADVSFEEDATPLDPSDSFGGVGAFEFVIPEAARAKSLLNKTVTVVDSVRGTTVGVVRAISGANGHVKVSALASSSVLVADRTALPHVGTLESLLTYYFGLCGITTGFTVDAAIADTAVVVPGWYGNVWEKVTKQLAPAYGFEVAVVDSVIVCRPPLREVLQGWSVPSWSLDESRLSQTVECWYYEPTVITDELIVGNEQSPVANIDAGEVIEFEIRLDASLSSVVQPVPVDAVSYDSTAASVYSVLDQYDDPVPPSVWEANGGRVTVEIGEDTRTIRVTVIGSLDRFLAPYRLAGIRVSGAEYSTLRILGTGVAFNREKYVLPASTDERATTQIGAEVDNDFITSWGHAHMVMLPAVRRHGMVSHRISDTVNVPGGFGNLAGARVFSDFNVFRTRSVSGGLPALDVEYTAEVDLTFGDVDDVSTAYTIEEIDALWTGGPISEFDLRPLLMPTGEGTPPASGYGSGVYGGPPTYGG